MERLRLVPIRLKDAPAYLERWHRHHPHLVGGLWAVGAAAGDELVAIAIVGRPVSREFDDGATVEVVRVAADGTPNACSLLYGAAARGSFAMGYTRVVSYTQAGESGSSLRAAGYRVIAERPARAGWSAPSRPRDDRAYGSVARQLWERVP